MKKSKTTDVDIWLGTVSSYNDMVDVLKKIENAPDELKKLASGWDEDEDEDEDEHWMLDIETESGIATITVEGSMVEGQTGWWGQYFGICGYDDIVAATELAIKVGATKFIYWWKTPGGSAEGIETVSTYLRDLKTKYEVVSFTDNRALSAGFWLATTFPLYATPMSQLGSVGVIGVHKEYTKMLENSGIKPKVFRSAPLKALGNPMEKLSPLAEKTIQEDIDKSHQFFVTTLVENLGLSESYIKETIATGAAWYAQEAKDLGLITAIKSFEQVFIALTGQTEENIDNTTMYSNIVGSSPSMLSDLMVKQFGGSTLPTGVIKQGEVSMRKKKTIEHELTAEESAALASGVPVQEVLKVTGNLNDEEAEVDVDVVTEETEEELEKDQSGLTLIKSLNAQLVNSQVQLLAAQNKITALEGPLEGLKRVVSLSTQRAYVGSGAAAPELNYLMSMDTSVLLQQFEQADALLSKRFGIGSRISSAETEDEDEEKSAKATLTQYNESILENCARIRSNNK